MLAAKTKLSSLQLLNAKKYYLFKGKLWRGEASVTVKDCRMKDEMQNDSCNICDESHL